VVAEVEHIQERWLIKLEEPEAVVAVVAKAVAQVVLALPVKVMLAVVLYMQLAQAVAALAQP
jgi:hypothetical protein